MQWWILGILGGVALVLGFFLFWKLWFLRQPARDVPREGIVSPADGKLVRIIPFHDDRVDVPKGLLGMTRTLTSDVAREGYILVIMLSPLNVHYQRAPSDGTVAAVKYTKGAFRNAVLGASELRALENEKNEILFDTKQGKMKVVQVAGVAARRISSFVAHGQRVRKGDVIGLINLGSQTLLVMPKRPLKVHAGQRMIDGETVIA